VMTAEDAHADGTGHARENVVHEAGLFQGKLGFNRAIILLEEGCEEFSNIEGLTHIRFPKGDVTARFEEIRRVLEREGLLARMVEGSARPRPTVPALPDSDENAASRTPSVNGYYHLRLEKDDWQSARYLFNQPDAFFLALRDRFGESAAMFVGGFKIDPSDVEYGYLVVLRSTEKVAGSTSDENKWLLLKNDCEDVTYLLKQPG
jgi:hypothetical protein